MLYWWIRFGSVVAVVLSLTGCGLLSSAPAPLPVTPSPAVDGYFRIIAPRSFPVYCSRSLNQCAKVTDAMQARLIEDMCIADDRFTLLAD